MYGRFSRQPRGTHLVELVIPHQQAQWYQWHGEAHSNDQKNIHRLLITPVDSHSLRAAYLVRPRNRQIPQNEGCVTFAAGGRYKASFLGRFAPQTGPEIAAPRPRRFRQLLGISPLPQRRPRG